MPGCLFILLLGIALPAVALSPAIENESWSTRYYIKRDSCERGANDYDDCVKHTKDGGLWAHRSIGVVRWKDRVCGIAHITRGNKTDVTRFVGKMLDRWTTARVQYSSSHNQADVAEAYLGLYKDSATWAPIGEWKTQPSGYHSDFETIPRATKPAGSQSYIVQVERECNDFLITGKPFEKLGWDF